jgi:hypothetical protein
MAPPSIHGDFEEQIGSRQEIAGNGILLEILNKLYVNRNDQTLIRGYTSSRKYDGFKNKLPAPGSLRRFTIICEQLKRTYDLGGIERGGMLQLLPSEFQIWLKS